MFTYKWYRAKVSRRFTGDIFWGKILDVPDEIIFSGETLKDCLDNFRRLADEYTFSCKAYGHVKGF